jgi:hypothetical protein
MALFGCDSVLVIVLAIIDLHDDPIWSDVLH